MENCFSIDSTIPNSYEDIANYLYEDLNSIILSERPIIFLCIGTDRSTGDSLGPLVGYKLQEIKSKKFYIYGNLESPIHSKNLDNFISKIYSTFNDPFVIAIDACLGSFQNINKIFIEHKPIYPGLAVEKDLPPIGDLSITGIVNISVGFKFMVLQNTRLNTVMNIADIISKGINHFILKCNDLNNFNEHRDPFTI